MLEAKIDLGARSFKEGHGSKDMLAALLKQKQELLAQLATKKNGKQWTLILARIRQKIEILWRVTILHFLDECDDFSSWLCHYEANIDIVYTLVFI